MILDKQTQDKIGKTFADASQKAKIVCKCDYCGAVFDRLKHNVERSWKVTKTDSCSDKVCVQKKRVASNEVLFGTQNAFQSEKIKEKIAETIKDRYGVDNAFQNKEIQEKQRATCKERYGFDNVFQNETIKNKSKATIMSKYGVSNVTQDKGVKKRQEDTLMKRYGVNHALQNPELRKQAMDTCIANFGRFPAHNYGKTQSDIQDWLNSFGFDFKSNRTLIPGFEIDLYDESKKLAIEYCGLHWHNEFSPEPRNAKYHRRKHDKCLEQGVQLLTIFSDEWQNREFQCKGHIKSILGINERKLYARKCVVKEIDKVTGRKFFDDNHIQGHNKLGVIFFGLFFEDELCGAMSLGRHNRQVSALVLDRLCFKHGTQIVGGASRLFAKCVEWAKSQGHSEIISFSDNRWSLGNVYTALKFNMANEYRADYSYVSIKNPNARLSKQSQKKDVVSCPVGMTEYEWAHTRGLARIWDCGKKRWAYNIQS